MCPARATSLDLTSISCATTAVLLRSPGLSKSSGGSRSVQQPLGGVAGKRRSDVEVKGGLVATALDDDLGFRQQGLGALVGGEGAQIEIDRDTVCQQVARSCATNLEHRAIGGHIDDRPESPGKPITQELLQRGHLVIAADDEPFIRAEP